MIRALTRPELIEKVGSPSPNTEQADPGDPHDRGLQPGRHAIARSRRTATPRGGSQQEV